MRRRSTLEFSLQKMKYSLCPRNLSKTFLFVFTLAVGVLLIMETIREKDTEDIKKITLTSEKINFDDAALLQEVEAEMQRRKTVIRKVCKQEGLGVFLSPYRKPDVKYPPIPNYEVFYFDRSHKVAWCPIYKAASTSWLYNFCLLGGLDEQFLSTSNTQLSELTRQLFPSLDYEDGKMAIEESRLSFFIVRHPFERLLSAYRDKLENKDVGREHGTLYFYEKIGKKIVAKYRKANDLKNATFNFVPKRYLHITANENFRLSQEAEIQSLHNHESVYGPEPTFEEFVRYLIDIDIANDADEHFLPYYLYCTPCSIEYDAIIQFSTLDRDQRYIIMKAHLEDKIKPVWKHKTRGRESSSLTSRYFSTLTQNQVMRLYEKYKIDFEMFEYSVSEYLQYAKAS